MASDAPPPAVVSPMLVLVDEDDREVGLATRAESHAGEGRLHRAFSVYLFDREGRALLQQRGVAKALWPGAWSNSACSHARPGEAVAITARRRVREELGLDVTLAHAFRYAYHARYGDAGSEREVCHVFVGTCDAPVAPDPGEVAATRLATVAAVDAELASAPTSFSPWFRIAWPRVRASHLPARSGATRSDPGPGVGPRPGVNPDPR